jgi:hypothetical protein
MQIWRHNINNKKAELNISEKQTNANKSSSIVGIAATFKRVEMF